MSAPEPGGPFLSIACWCDSIEPGVDGRPTLVGVTSAILPAIPTGTDPQTAMQMTARLKFVVELVGIAEPSEHELLAFLERPFGAAEKVQAVRRVFADSTQRRWITEFWVVVPTVPAVYWMRVELDGRQLTRVPLRVLGSQPAPMTAH